MNCKPGDLAVIVRDPLAAENVGKLVHVLGRADPEQVSCYAGEEWRCSSPSPIKTFGVTGWEMTPPGESIYIFDAELRPIRDPGDDAVDQTLVPGYVKDEVTA